MDNSSGIEYARLSDIILHRLMQTGDEAAFREIYRKYWQLLFGIAYRKLQSQENAEEIVQDIFVDIWERRASLQIDDLRKYLMGAAKYRILNAIKARLIRERYAVFCQSQTGYTDPLTENELAFQDLTKAVEQALLSMSPKTQAIFRLNRFDNQSVREIAIQLSVPERTVEYHITLALRTLRLQLKEFAVK
ncbi:RNA polymerase sigma-70 factor [Nibrella saemangeumensis]|uniref:RNA polymerase sigma-70 factor n=2 Tax=Nibrella saemangeumensis TaxID=1084526 RepID=A0ABP8MQ91_9BACT